VSVGPNRTQTHDKKQAQPKAEPKAKEEEEEDDEEEEVELSPLESLARKIDFSAPGLTMRKLDQMLMDEIIECDLARVEKANRRRLKRQQKQQTTAMQSGDKAMFKSVVPTPVPDTPSTGSRGRGWSFSLPKCLQFSSLRAQFSQNKDSVHRISTAQSTAG